MGMVDQSNYLSITLDNKGSILSVCILLYFVVLLIQIIGVLKDYRTLF